MGSPDGASPATRRSGIRRLLATVGAGLSAVVLFLSGTIFAPVVTRYVPLLSDVIDVRVGNEPLVTNVRWPVSGGCDPGTEVAMPVGHPEPTALSYSLEEDPRITAVRAGAASWGTGVLQVSLRARDSRTVNINSIAPVVLRRTTDEPSAWVLRLDKGGCGGGPGSVAVPDHILDLDRGPLIESKGRPVTARTDDLPIADFRGAAITTTTPLDLAVAVRSCAGLYEWQLVVDYSSGGLTDTLVIGPFLSTRAQAGVPLWGVRPGTATPGRTLVRDPASTTATCP